MNPQLSRRNLWDAFGSLIHEQTGRKLVGTRGGTYVFSPTEIRVPDLDIEAAVHELCHWVVANDSERKQVNLGLSQDWQHPNYDRMVRCEEMAWSLEFYLFGDPTVEKMASYLTPEARASGGGYNITRAGMFKIAPGVWDDGEPKPEDAAKAEYERAKALVQNEAEHLRRSALGEAERVGLRVKELKRLIALECERRESVEQQIKAFQAEMDALQKGSTSIEDDWEDIRLTRR